MKTISIFGSTGSIGTQTVDILRGLPEYSALTLTAASNVSRMEEQARLLKPRAVCLYEEEAARALRLKLADMPLTVFSGEEGLLKMIEEYPADVSVLAISGMIALKPALALAKQGGTLAIASKEPLVCAGHLIMPLARSRGTRVLPVDSEHCAVFQCLTGEDPQGIRRLWLTASGGPFRGKSRRELADIRPEDALRHPNWSMGRKITVDSATMANKGLEVMEAHQLFGVPYENIRAVVHPQSIIHSMAEFTDGSVKAQLGVPDMRIPIEYALRYPARGPMLSRELDFWQLGDLHFEKPDTEAFPALELAYRAGQAGGTLPTVFNAADEWAVDAFLKGRLFFLQIADVIGEAMARHTILPEPSLETILETESAVRAYLSEGL